MCVCESTTNNVFKSRSAGLQLISSRESHYLIPLNAGRRMHAKKSTGFPITDEAMAKVKEVAVHRRASEMIEGKLNLNMCEK